MKNTTLCYIEQNGAYLLLHRVKKQNDINHDKWIGIGGKFEEGESPEDCVRREAREETGLELTDLKYCGIVTFLSDGMDETEFMHLFRATQFTGELKTCDEGVLEWIPKEKNSLLRRLCLSIRLQPFRFHAAVCLLCAKDLCRRHGLLLRADS